MSASCVLYNETLFSQCSNISLHHLRVLALVRGSVGIFCFLLCLATFLFELVYICRKKASTTLQRLFVYLTLSTLFYTGVLSLHSEHFFQYNQEAQCIVCKMVGFLDEYTGCVQFLLTLGIIFKLLHKMSSFWQNSYLQGGCLSRHHMKLEIGFVATCFLLPLTVMWVPFLNTDDKPGSYGLQGAWCWIQAIQEDCQDSSKGYLEQLFLWYVPYAVVSTLSLICVVVIIIFLIYICLHYNLYRNKIRAVMTEILLLLPFLVAFSCVCMVEITIVVLLRYGRNYNLHLHKFPMLMCYAITTPIGGVVIPIAFFVYFLRRKGYSLPPHRLREVSNIRTVRPSSRVSVDSCTSKQERPNFLSNSDVAWETSSGSAVVVDPLLCESYSKYGSVES